MKKTLLAITLGLAAMTAMPAAAKADRFSLSIGGPVYAEPAYRPYYPQPVYYAPQPVYYAPSPAYYPAYGYGYGFRYDNGRHWNRGNHGGHHGHGRGH